MRSAAGRIVLKIVILLSCIACVITKALTDQLSRRVFLRNQKLSREWGLLHNLYWSTSGNAFANVTYGGFTLITVLMLISRFIDAKSRPSLVEKIFLTVGMLCFFAMGGVVFSAFDQVPSDLHVNAIVLGCLSFFVAFLMLIDLADPMARHISGTTQTDFIATIDSPPQTTTDSKDIQKVLPPQSNQQYPANPTTHDIVSTNGKYARGDEVDIVQAQMLPSVQQPVFEKVLLPEKQRPHRHNVQDPRSNTARLEYSMQPACSFYGNDPPSPNQPRPNDLSPIPTRPQHQSLSYSPTYSRHSTHQSHPHNQQRPTFNSAPQTNNLPPAANQRNYNIRQNSNYSKNNIHPHHQQQPNHHHHRPHQQTNTTSSCRRNPTHPTYGHCNNSISSGDEDNNRAIQPGFVAHAARFWDNRAKQNEELNTIV